VFSARSYHSNGVNVAFMDGSTRFISDSVELSVWCAISTRSGGETISADQF
jgi:prepilin-type processing-associated H-X9-DG protein